MLFLTNISQRSSNISLQNISNKKAAGGSHHTCCLDHDLILLTVFPAKLIYQAQSGINTIEWLVI